MRTLAMFTVLKVEPSGRHTVFKRPTLSSLLQRKGEIRNNGKLEERDCMCVCLCVYVFDSTLPIESLKHDKYCRVRDEWRSIDSKSQTTSLQTC